MRRIIVEDVRRIAFELAKTLMSWNEPIPDFGTRYPNVLESCVATPFQAFGMSDAYHGLERKAAVLFYLMIKNHPFQNGNKRIAVTTLLVFLYLNGKWARVDDQELYNFAVWVARSPSRLKDSVIDGIEKFLRDSMIDLNEK